jgi:hypothetical protein
MVIQKLCIPYTIQKEKRVWSKNDISSALSVKKMMLLADPTRRHLMVHRVGEDVLLL